MVSEMKWKQFCCELTELENIYDLLVSLYLQIEGKNKQKYVKHYYETLAENPVDYWGDLSLIIDELLRGYISFSSFIEEFKKCVNENNLHNVAIRILFEFDRYFANRKKYPALELKCNNFCGRVYEFGPLNKVKSEYGLYLMPDDHYFKDFNKDNELGIRFLDQSQFSMIERNIRHYKIIKQSSLGKRVKIKYYAEVFGLLDNYPELRIGIVPVSKTLWCKMVCKEYGQGERNYFRLEDIEEQSALINEFYIKILRKCMEENIQIVVFPELARNRETEKQIKDFLIKEKLKNPNSLALVFMGSLWENGKNEGILLSGTGTILLRSQKMEPFSLRYGNKTYWEDLEDEVQEIQLLDIPKIGRIQYLICKDGLNDGLLHNMWGLFEIAMSFISSYSNSISHFEEVGSGFSAQYAGIQVLSNACAARMGVKRTVTMPQEQVGHVIFPCARERTGTPSSQKESYETMSHCEEGCCFGGCIRVFRINPNLISEDNGILGNYVETECIIL